MSTNAVLSPDSFTSVRAGDLSQADYEALASVWPAAFAAVTSMLRAIEAGDLSEATSELDMPLWMLVWEYA